MAFPAASSPPSPSNSFFARQLIRLRRLTGAFSSETTRISQTVKQLASSIPAISRDIESRYLKSGSVLQPLTEASLALTLESNELLRLAVGKAEGDQVINGTMKLLENPLDYLERWSAQVVLRLAELQSCHVVFVRLHQSESTLQSVVAPLHHMQTMFRVESARLSEDVRQIFVELTAQLAKVHAEVRDTFGEQFQIVAQTLHTLNRVTASVNHQAQAVESDLSARKQQIAAALATLQRELDKGGERDVELSSMSQAIASSISDIVVALQTHDIVSQRLEHVRQGLQEACGLLESSDRPAGTGSADPFVKAFYLLNVQRAQLDGVHSQLDTSERSLLSAIEAITSKVVTLGSDCLLLKQFEDVTVASNGSVQISFEMLQDVRGLLAGVVSTSRDFYQAIEPIGQLTSSLTGALEGLSNKMRLIALNAQVQAVQIGTGTGLEILAAHISGVSSETSILAEAIAGDIGHLVDTVRALTRSFQEITKEGEQTLGNLQIEGAEHENNLHDLRNRTLAKLNSVAAAIDGVQQCTQVLSSQNDLRSAALAPIESAISGLDLATQDLNRLIYDFDVPLDTQIEGDRYCMASERDAHQQAMKSFGPSRSEQSTDGSSDSSDGSVETESLVELF